MLFVVLMAISAPLEIGYAKSSTGTTSSKIIEVTKKIIISAAKVGIETAGSSLMGPAWPYLKAAVRPVLDELKERYPGFASAINGYGPNAEAEAARAVDAISTDPRLQNLIIDGFSNLESGQRNIVNRIGELETILSRQNESILILQKASDKKIDRLIALVDKLAKERPNKIYTEGITMYDISGEWTLERFQPPLPATCEFRPGQYGLSIDVIDSAMSATGSFSLVLPLLDPEDKELFDVTSDCLWLAEPKTSMALYGSILRIHISGNYYFSYEVEIRGNILDLSWINAEGKTEYLTFSRNPQ